VSTKHKAVGEKGSVARKDQKNTLPTQKQNQVPHPSPVRRVEGFVEARPNQDSKSRRHPERSEGSLFD
jgi:hypothetical protein